MTITEAPERTGRRHIEAATISDDRSARRTRPRTREALMATPTEHLEAEAMRLVRRLHFGTYELLALVGELDDRGAWATWGALSCAAWLADLRDIEVCTARTQVRVARSLREFPVLDEAMATGAISYAKARTLAGHLTPDNADALLTIARTTPAGRLGTAIAAWCLGHEDQEVIDTRQHDARSLSWHTAPDGMVVFTIKMPPEEGGRIEAIIDTEVIRHDPGTPAGPAERSCPLLTQQRADALLRLLDTADAPGTSNDPATDADRTADGSDNRLPRRTVVEVVVHVRPDGNTLADGTPLSDHVVGRLLPDAFVSLLMEDNRRHPIDASPRRRFPTRRQRRVVDERDPECAHGGCHARDFLQYDHREPYDPDHANTVIANLQRLCGPHNRAKGNRPHNP